MQVTSSAGKGLGPPATVYLWRIVLVELMRDQVLLERDYLWLMSLAGSEGGLEAFKARAVAEGFELEKLIVVEQSR